MPEPNEPHDREPKPASGRSYLLERPISGPPGSETRSEGWQDGSPYELTQEELIFPQILDIGDVAREIWVHLRRYSNPDLRELLSNTGIAYESAGSRGKIRAVSSNASLVQKFFDDHFLKLSKVSSEDGSEPSLEIQKEWLAEQDPLRDIKRRAVLLGFGGIHSEISGEDPGGTLVLTVGKKTEKVSCRLIMVDPEMGKARFYNFCHVFRMPTKADGNRHSRSTGETEINTRKSQWGVDVDHDALELLYNDLIERAEGYSMQGEECLENNKERWVRQIPYWHKYHALEELFRGVQTKNLRSRSG